MEIGKKTADPADALCLDFSIDGCFFYEM